MAVMTHALARTNADYTDLTRAQQQHFDHLMDQADNARTGDAYHTAMTEAALTAGLQVPASRDIARCSCWTDTDGCGCALVFDAHATGVVVTAVSDPGFNLSQLQCPDCGHDHPRPIAD